jgi:hypothetical protein
MRALFTSKHIVPKVYKVLLDKAFGAEWLVWEPETVWSEIASEYGVRPSAEVKTKINALRVFLTTNQFWTDAPAFENIVLAVNDMMVDPTSLQLATPEELVYALRFLLPMRKAPGDFSREVCGYVATVFRKAGFLKFPAVCGFAQPDYLMHPEFAKLLPQIEARTYDSTDNTSIVQVQSGKLAQLNSTVAMKIAAMDIEALEPSAE